jgi:predicted Zn-dependent peptidase
MQASTKGNPYQIISLPNGLRIAYLRVKGTRLFHAGFTINTGSKDDDHLPGLAHCLEHMLFKGTTTRKTIHVLNRMESVGGEINAFTTKDLTSIYGTSTSNHYGKLIDILCDVIFRSTIPSQELSKEKKVIVDEINMYLDTPEENIYDEFQEQIFGNHPLAHNILGTPESVNTIEQKDLLRFIEKHYQFNNMVFSVVGNISLERVVSMLEKFLPESPKLMDNNKVNKINYQPFTAIPAFQIEKKTDYNQAYAMIGCYAYELQHPKRWSLLLLNHLLGGPSMNSRLNLAIREKYGYTYNVESGYAAFDETGLFHCFVGSEPKYIHKSVSLIFKELEKLRTYPLGSIQLSRAKNQYIGQITVANESRTGLMIHMGQSLIKKGYIQPLQETIQAIQSVTTSNILDTANELLLPENFSSLLYLPDAETP